MILARRLHVVPSAAPPRATPAPAAEPDRGDLALLAMLFGVNVVPFVGDALARGRWGAGTLGLAAAGAMVTGRELVLGARALLRRRR